MIADLSGLAVATGLLLLIALGVAFAVIVALRALHYLERWSER